jgi:UV radiation resistance-associated gene protein
VDTKLERQRGLLFSSLSSIFPIELLSASDLLFEILDAPLPIPSNSTDPAPPSTLHGVPRLNAEIIASAFGHVAQVVQIGAAYMAVNLPYPVTCIGSRSIVKDPISLMMGPRR